MTDSAAKNEASTQPEATPDATGEAPSPPEQANPETDSKEPTTAEQVSEIVAGIQAESDVLKRLATSLGPFAKASSYQDVAGLGKSVERVAARLADASSAPPAVVEAAEKALELVRGEVEERKRRMRESLAPELRAACEARGLGLRVLRREEPVELRIPPLGVVIDRDKGKAELRFARLPLATAPADAIAIVQAHQEAVSALNGKDFDGKAFFAACRRAWSAARAAGGGSSERVEILDFLPYLALQMQPAAFQVDPSERNYSGYSRVQFAWDVLRLRRGAGFSHDGWRLNLGVATGTTATQKKRVIWFEDENGDGEFKLTVFFTRTEGN